MRILFLSAWFPYPPDNGSKLRINNLLRGLSAQHDISLLSFADNPNTANIKALHPICDSVKVLPTGTYDAYSKKAIKGFIGRKPRVLADRYVPAMDKLIRKEIAAESYDLIVASQIYMADYCDSFAGTPAVFEEAEVGVFTDAVHEAENRISKFRHQLTLLKLQSYFRELLPKFSFSTVVSETEKKLLQDLVPEYHSIEVIPNGVDLSSYGEIERRPVPGSLVFSGALTFAPNYDAMQWFTGKVLPLVQNKYPKVKLTITGNHGGATLPNSKNVHFSGYVDDIRPSIASAWISIAPIFSGGGTRLKILEAFGLKTAVIATTKGAEGLAVEHEKHILIADTPESFAQQTIRLLNDENLRNKLTDNAYQLVREKYDWSVITPQLLSKFEKLVPEPKIDLPVKLTS